MTYLLSGELSPSDSFFHLSHARMKRVARKRFSSGFLLPYLSPTAIVTNPFPPFLDEPIVGPNALQDPMYAIVEKDYIYAGPFRLVQEMFPASITLESVATVGGRIVKNGNNLQPRYYITDHLGSTRVVLDNFGSVLERYDYHPYGEIVPVSVASSGNTDYLYTGKESQNALFGINWYDSGARFQTTDGIFTGIDPLAEKYYHISPYAYCAGDPVNYVDPTGEYTYYVSRKGKITREGEEEDYDTVYSEDQSSSIILFDTSIMAELYNNGNNKGTVEKPQGTGVKSYVTSDHANAIYKTFKFLADNTGVEWVVHRNGDQYTLGTLHLSSTCGNWTDYGLEKPNASVHSHPDTGLSLYEEKESMGYWPDGYAGDARKARRDIRANGISAEKNYVYFPNSSHLYFVEYYNPRYIRSINNYRQFYFGTLNHR